MALTARLSRFLLLPFLFFWLFFSPARAVLGGLQPQLSEGCEYLAAMTSRGGAAAPRGPACSLRPQAGVLVERVVDGDTIVLAGGERVRYIGIDTPEVVARPEPFGPEATAFNRALVAGRAVRLERDVSERDRFGRLLRYVYVDGLQVNAELVREGYAEARAYPPDTRYARCLEELEQEARKEGRGQWRRN